MATTLIIKRWKDKNGKSHTALGYYTTRRGKQRFNVLSFKPWDIKIFIGDETYNLLADGNEVIINAHC